MSVRGVINYCMFYSWFDALCLHTDNSYFLHGRAVNGTRYSLCFKVKRVSNSPIVTGAIKNWPKFKTKKQKTKKTEGSVN